jgi:hypothetical protein
VPGHWAFALGAVLFALAMSLLWVLGSTSARAATPTDVMFVFDTSGSMSGVLEEATAEIQGVMAHIDAVVPEVDYGVAEVRDYGGSGYDEEEFDVPWNLVRPITADHAAVSDAISLLFADGGGDAPEAYGRALWESDTNPFVGWRPGARHAIVLIADEVPHMPNVDAGMPEALWYEPAPWDTGEELPGTWGIPGTQLPPGQQTEFLEVLHKLAADGKPLEMVDYHDTEANFIHYWEYWASLAGGQALEAGGGDNELANKLIAMIEAAAPPCATTATPTQPSPHPPSTLPAALTARFGGPATKVTIVPAAGTRFCPGQRPSLGGAAVTSFEESTPAQIAFRVPSGAAGGLTLSGAGGAAGPVTPYEVDSFRFPWGMKLRNYPGSGAGGTYDNHAGVTAEDLDSVYAGLGPRGSTEYRYAEENAEWALENGLCYGFGLLELALYGNSHGSRSYPLSWASSKGFQLHPTTTPYSLRESSGGSHAVTHALVRAAISQFSPQAQKSMRKEGSAKSLAADLNTAFQADQPAMLSIHFNGEGHTLLAYNYQSPDPTTGEGLAVDVLDPNIPWTPGRPSSDYEQLQIHVRSNGTWHYSGSFPSPFATPVGSSSGSLYVQTAPPMPGGLSLIPVYGGSGDVLIKPRASAVISGLSYSSSPGHGIPDDAEPETAFVDARSGALTVPSDHHIITATIRSKSGKGTSAVLVGPGFLDSADIPGSKNVVNVSTQSGAIGAPSVPAGTTLSATSVAGEVEQTATVTFSGRVRRPRVTVGQQGGVTVTTAGGSGRASIKLAAFAPGQKAHAPSQVVRIHGHTRVRGHTPKVKHRRHRKPCKGGSGQEQRHCPKK